jgi:hypothetical protein
MIRYTLKCAKGHAFESWFKDSSAYDKLAGAGQVVCAVCGSKKVEKTIMAPSVGGTKKSNEVQSLSEPASPAEQALKKLHDHVRENSDYVGRQFAEEARKIHLGEAEARGIYGEATKEDAKALKEDGIPVAPLPFMSRQDD